jgi:hypothetical protein
VTVVTPARTTRRQRRCRRARLCTRTLIDVDAFERRRLNSRNCAKHSRRDRARARERDEIEHLWGCGKRIIAPHLDPSSSRAPEILGGPSPPQAHFAVGGARRSTTASPSPLLQSGAGPSVKPSQSNNCIHAGEKFLDHHRPTTTNPRPSPSRSPMDGPNGEASTPPTTQVQTNGTATVVKSVASASIVEVVQHAHPNGIGSLVTTDRDECVRKVLTLIHVRPFYLFLSMAFDLFRVVRLDRLMPHSWTGFEQNIVRGRSVSGHLCVLIAVTFFLWPPLPYSPFALPPPTLCCTEISVSMYWRTMRSHLHRNIFIFDAVFLLVCVCLSRDIIIPKIYGPATASKGNAPPEHVDHCSTLLY